MIADHNPQSLHDRFKRGEIGPDYFRAKQSAKAKKRATTLKRKVDVLAFLDRYQIPINGTNGEANFSRYSVTCPACDAKDAYIMQHNDGGVSMGCYHDSCPYSNKRGDHWEEFKAHYQSNGSGTNRSYAQGGPEKREKQATPNQGLRLCCPADSRGLG